MAPPETATRLDDLRARAIQDLAAHEALISNKHSYEKTIEKHERNFAGMRILARIPKTPDIDALKQQLIAHAAWAGFVISDVRVTERAIVRRNLPETFSGARPFEFNDDDIRGVLDMTCRLSPASREAIPRFVSEMPGRVDRMVRTLAITERDSGYDVTAEAYFFLDIAPPRHVVPPFDMEAILKAGGVGLPPAALRAADGSGALAEIEKDYASLNARLGDINASMAVLSRTHLYDAQYAFFLARVRDIEAIKPADLLR